MFSNSSKLLDRFCDVKVVQVRRVQIKNKFCTSKKYAALFENVFFLKPSRVAGELTETPLGVFSSFFGRESDTL